ncbi:hypothetical protein M409DRAFT_26485 [Zasmidium cellare ATCC 36951]|uniref:Uncharacterized protein n=1 Tax=Zasmidium cellare ATCC 36951 TaxID=1080233 RepID=A0A6A6CBK1_ZASCE|nr:uncharacterized protein M409DRAFT_26485 [Zasmidium cellare ATCC 36951]KAF2163039.1 hypothetical protein M409DRAFT_26485 [Zasmidium cellare ATCC 36951]
MFSEKFRFTRIPSTDEDGEDGFGSESKCPQPRNSVLTSSSFTRAAALLTLFLSVILGLTIVAISTTSSRPTWTSCGNDPATAKSRGCSFDLLSFAWQTPECYDTSLMDEFASWNHDSDWNFYNDPNYTEPVSQQIASQGERGPLFVKWDYHVVHCTFMWRQMHRAYEKGWIDSHLANYNHTLHCQKMILMSPEDAVKKPVMARLIYPECLRVKH